MDIFVWSYHKLVAYVVYVVHRFASKKGLLISFENLVSGTLSAPALFTHPETPLLFSPHLRSAVRINIRSDLLRPQRQSWDAQLFYQ
jgi:hypothetical protein